MTTPDPRNRQARAFAKRTRAFIDHHRRTFYTPIEFMGLVDRYGAVGTLLKLAAAFARYSC